MKIFVTSLFNILSKRFHENKIEKNKKNALRESFIERLIDAKSNIHLFGMNSPNIFIILL